MSPEIIENECKYSYNTDCWSAGCVLFELITLKIFRQFMQENQLITNDDVNSGFKTLLLM